MNSDEAVVIHILFRMGTTDCWHCSRSRQWDLPHTLVLVIRHSAPLAFRGKQGNGFATRRMSGNRRRSKEASCCRQCGTFSETNHNDSHHPFLPPWSPKLRSHLQNQRQLTASITHQIIPIVHEGSRRSLFMSTRHINETPYLSFNSLLPMPHAPVRTAQHLRRPLLKSFLLSYRRRRRNERIRSVRLLRTATSHHHPRNPSVDLDPSSGKTGPRWLLAAGSGAGGR